MKKLLVLLALAIFAMLFVSCASSVQKPAVNTEPAWVNGPLVYEDGNKEVYSVGSSDAKDLELSKSLAERMANKRIQQFLKQDDASGQMVTFYRNPKTRITYVLVKYVIKK